MPTIKFIEADGSTIEVNVNEGTTLMQAAVDNMVPGILGDCGGSGSCGTCHCFIEKARCLELPQPDEDEQAMLEMMTNRQLNSRLSCQIDVKRSLAGLEVYLPEEQSF